MRFTSKFKKKLNGSSGKQSHKEHSNQSHSQDIVCDPQSFETKLKFEDCKYGKFVPRNIGDKLHDTFDLVALHNLNSADSKHNRSEHLQIITRFIFSSAYCSRSKITAKSIQLNKLWVKNDTKKYRTDDADGDTTEMLKISKEFLKMVKKTVTEPEISHRGIYAELSDYDQKYSLQVLTQTQHIAMREMKVTKSRTERMGNDSFTKSDSDYECSTNLFLSPEIKSVESLDFFNKDHWDCHLRNKFATGDHKTANVQCHQSKIADMRKGHQYEITEVYDHQPGKAEVQDHQSRIAETCDHQLGVATVHNHLYGTNCEKQPYEETYKMYEIQYSSRFGEINEMHCNAVFKLVNQRLNGKNETSSLEVCVFIQENVKEIGEFISLKLDLTHKCLSTYFFPGKNLVSVSVQRDLKKFLNRTVFQKSTTVKDLFGERHCFDDDLNIKAVVMISHPIFALFRHRDICLLDTLQVILGIDRSKLLVLTALGKN
ncbi:uncharacterized protein LOC123523022 isoform X1 [Mercenaria mercenaria]|uniref:uncharacterized protein LOC123523022 isoform X1 n=1 Tax=Mercenaria mercenaria TaxID=6596 RepID=UPI00234F1023|nr:uncharacterized protein LOC123523022 isoform X1 [Mercenaria mercenaria]